MGPGSLLNEKLKYVMLYHRPVDAQEVRARLRDGRLCHHYLVLNS